MNVLKKLFGKKKVETPTGVNDDEKEYSFIWYREMKVGGTTNYTVPCRTKVKAKNFTDAKIKCVNFAIGKMKLIVVEESNYNKTNLASFEKSFESLNKQMNDLFSKFKI
jgi:hypothetical protein